MRKRGCAPSSRPKVIRIRSRCGAALRRFQRRPSHRSGDQAEKPIMKMPRRPWYPNMQPRPDIFGLHHVTLLGAACETSAEREQRVAKVEVGVKAAFKAAVHHL